jgi:hypothetical protein
MLYHWHPWFGMRVAIHEAVDKADEVVLHCTLSGSAADQRLEVPAWMFDRVRCLDSTRLTASPFVSMDALSGLSDLLRQALRRPLPPSNAPHSGASRSSHDQNRGEVQRAALISHDLQLLGGGGISFLVSPICDHAFLSRAQFERLLSHNRLELLRFTPQAINLATGRRPPRIA